MKIGLIGTGNMGASLAEAIAVSGMENDLYLANRTRQKAEVLAKKIGASVSDNAGIAAECDWIFLGVKPDGIAPLIASIRPELDGRSKMPVFVSMAAGVSLGALAALLPPHSPLVRMMPNTPVAVGEGMILYCCKDIPGEDEALFCRLLSRAGKLLELPEKNMDAGSALSGCGPAFVYLFAEALADGGVACGLPRSAALLLASQTLLGSASLLLETKKHPGELKDAVCSPAGSTIEGVKVLEEEGLRGAAMAAVIASYEKTKALGKTK